MSFKNREITTFESQPISLKPLPFSSVRRVYRASATLGAVLPPRFHVAAVDGRAAHSSACKPWLPRRFLFFLAWKLGARRRPLYSAAEPLALSPPRPVACCHRPLQPLTAELVKPRTPADSPLPLKPSRAFPAPFSPLEPSHAVKKRRTPLPSSSSN